MWEQIVAGVQTWLTARGEDALSLAGILGALIGAISFLFHALINSKDEQNKQLRHELEDVSTDRDFWRDVALGTTRPSDKEAWLDARVARVARQAPTDTP